MKKRAISFLCIALVMVLCLGIGAFAASNLETISAYLNYGVTIKYDGVAQTMTDATGTRVYPITYNGTTYLPVRAVSGMLGLPVDWDGATQTVYLGEKPGEAQYLLDVCKPYVTSGDYKEFTPENGLTFNMGGATFTNGFNLFTQWGDSTAVFNLDGKYDKLSFTMGHVDGTGNYSRTMKIFLDGKLYESYDMIFDDLPLELEIPVSGVLQLKFALVCPGGGDYFRYGVGDVTIE